MRAGMRPEWLCDAVGRVVALNLGADFTAEHECGIKGLKRILGMDGQVEEYSREKPIYTKPHGIARRTITDGSQVKLFEHKGEALLICQGEHYHKYLSENIERHGADAVWDRYIPGDLRSWRAKDLATAWDDSSFGVLAKKADVEKLRELYQAFQANNIAVWLGARVLFKNGGLVLCIADRAPSECLETMRAGDEDTEKLQAASDATGITKRLADAGKGYFACSPRWITDDMKKKSAHPVMYWLNPTEQDKNNYGWYTVEQLDQWIKGAGPIPNKGVSREQTASRSKKG